MEDRTNEQKYPGNSYSSIKPRYSQIGTQDTSKSSPPPAPVAKGREAAPSFKDKLLSTIDIPTKEQIVDRIIFNWVVPTAKNIVCDIIDNMFFKNGRGRGSSSRSDYKSSSRPYNSYYEGRDSAKSEQSGSPKLTHRPSIEFETRDAAMKVLDELRDDIELYHKATMKNFYAYADLNNLTNRQMDNVGWRNLDDVEPEQIRGGGWKLSMPRVEDLNGR